MAITIPATTLGGQYRQTLLFKDHAGEPARKVSVLWNGGDANNIDAQLNALVSLTNAALYTAAVSEDHKPYGLDDPVPVNTGLYTLCNVRLILGFSAVHPLNPAKTIIGSYAIPAPKDAIVSTANPKKPVMTRGVTFALADTAVERLGAIVDWLETALSYRAADGEWYSEIFTYSEARSGLMTVSGIIDSDILT